MQGHTELQIGKWGNSLGIRLPKYVSDVLRLKAKDKVRCEIIDGKLMLEPIRPSGKYTLEELLAKADEPGEEISWGKPEGEEIW